jgi:TonB-dependent starch-binding outer membrane protein SusC
MHFKALFSPPFGEVLTKTVRVMKLTAVILLAACLQVSARGYGQLVTLRVQHAPLEQVLAEIQRQTGFNFVYAKIELQGAKPVDLDLHEADLAQTLAACFKDQPLAYTIVDQYVVVKKKVAVADNANNENRAPPGEVHGHITDSVGRPLEGANVQIKGDKHGTETDKNGDFVLRNVADNSTLIISNIGYETQTVKLTGGKEVRISLRGSQSELDQVVFKGYYNSTNRLNTGDVTTVKGETINEQPVTDPILALEGRVPGLYIQQTSGVAGAYSTIRIMGQNSIANGNDPLYIVDGVPFSSVSLSSASMSGGAIGLAGGNISNTNGGGVSPFNTLNPADIENIEVLKDADATAIYGSRGANGVILITTKKGKAGATRLDVNVYSGTGQVNRMLHLMNTTQYLEMRREAFENDGLAIPSISVTPSNTDYDINGWWDMTRNTNWQKVLIGNMANFTNAQANVSGGNVNTQFVVGGGYSKQGTTFIGDYSDQKASGHMSLTHASTDQRFHLQIGVDYIYDNSNLPTVDFTSDITLAPDAPALYDGNDNINWAIYQGTATFSNPTSVKATSSNAASTNLISNLNLSYQLLSGLQLKATLGYNQEEMNENYLFPGAAITPPYNIPANAYNTFATTRFTTWIIEPQLNYQRNFGLGEIEALVGSTFQQNVHKSLTQEASDFTSDALINDPTAAASLSVLGTYYAMYRYDAIYGRIGYNYAGKYIINLTARRDGSSRFGPGRQFGNFGAAGVGWIFTKERFLENHFPGLSFGKLRASYGITGSDQITDYQYLSTYTPSSTTYEGVSGLYPTALTNPYFAWEVVKKLEGGLDLGFLKDRILVSATYFRNRTGNQLVGEPLPSVTGFSTVEFNLPATVQNAGLELTVNSINIRSNAFKWTSAVNFTLPSNKLLAFPDINQYSAYRNKYVIGKSIFITHVFHSIGVNPQTGLYSFVTKNANGSPTAPRDQITTKPITQRYYGGFQNSFSYKGFQLDVFIQYVNQLGYNYQNSFVYPPGYVNFNEPTAVVSRWRSSEDITGVQRFGTGAGAVYTPYANLKSSDAVITNASFIRFKNVALSYSLPSNWGSKIHLQTSRIYLQCQNLFTITRYLGLDPETQGLVLPPLRMITAGLQMNLQ